MSAGTQDIAARLLHDLVVVLAWLQDRVGWGDSTTVGGWRP